jgi:hypothetical protein
MSAEQPIESDDGQQEPGQDWHSDQAVSVPFSAPVHPELRSRATDVDLASVSTHNESVASFLHDLFSATPSTVAPDVERYRLPHPADANAYANILSR